MTFKIKSTATAVALTLLLGSSAAFAKMHDQGIADGEGTPDNTGALIQTLEAGVSSLVNDGARGDAAPTAGGDNAVDPIGTPNNEPN